MSVRGNEEKPKDSGGSSPASHMTVSWRVIAVLSLIVAAGLLVTLCVVMARSASDSLATTALALAIIAFGVQLIVYVAQVSDSTDSRRQTAEVSAATKEALARIGTTVAASDQLLRDQNTQLLQSLLGDVRKAEQQAKESDSSLTVADVMELIDEAQSRSAGIDGSDVDDSGSEWEPDYEADPFGEWPDEEAAPIAHSTLRGLDPVSIGQLIRYADDYRSSLLFGSEPGLLYTGPDGSPFTLQLIEAGLIRTTGRFPRGRPPKSGFRPVFATLTDDGLTAAQLLMTRGSAPEWVRKLLVSESVTSEVRELRQGGPA